MKSSTCAPRRSSPKCATASKSTSVGSLLGLCAILFGKLWRDAGLPIPVAAACTLGMLQGHGAPEWLADCPNPWLAVTTALKLHGTLAIAEARPT